MKCPTCVEGGQQSVVYDRGSNITLMSYTPYWDEGGIRHDHDPNIVKTAYDCSRGHYWIGRHKRPCPAGDYPT